MKLIAYGAIGDLDRLVGVKSIKQEGVTVWRVTLEAKLPKHAICVVGPEMIGAASCQVGWSRVRHEAGDEILIIASNHGETLQVGFAVYNIGKDPAP